MRELADVQLLDANGNPLTQWTLKDLNEDQDVFNQDGRIAGIAPAPPLPTAVPEPATFVLLLTGLFVFGGVRWRRSRRFAAKAF